MDDFEKVITAKLIPPIISQLIRNQIISEKSSDAEVWQAVHTYVNDEDFSLAAVITGSENFIPAIESAISNRQKDVAITLAGILFEQMTNEFYHKILLDEYNFSRSEYESCMKGVSVKDKLTWLYKIVTSESIDDNIINQIHTVCSARNYVVHYKPRVIPLDSSDDLGDKLDSIAVEDLLLLIKTLQNIFLECNFNIFPEEKISNNIFNRIYEKNNC